MFFGRAKEIKRLQIALSPENARVSLTALEGQGGIGKTRLALEYVQQHGLQTFPGGVFWFSGEQDAEAQFHEMLCQLAPDQELPELAEMRQLGPDAVRGAFARELERRGERALWVVDNLPEPVEGSPVDLDDWRLELGCLSILFTARARVLFGAGVPPITVPSLDEEAAVDMLLANRVGSLSNEQREHAEIIVEAVGKLPLALEILAVELEYTSLKELASVLASEESSAVVDQVMRGLEGYVAKDSLRGVVKTFVRSYDRLDESTRELAHVLACFGPEAIPRSLVEALGEPVTQLRGSLRTLQTRHFLTGQDPNEGLIGQMHRVLASFLRGLRVNQRQRDTLTRARDALLRDWDERGDDGMSRDRGILEPHIAAWCEHLSRTVSQEDTKAADVSLWSELGVYWYQNGSFKKAKPQHERAYAFARRVFGERHPDTLTSMNNFANTLQAMGDLKQARELQEEALKVRRAELGERHLNTLTSMNNFANTLRAMGDLKQARELQEEVLEIFRAELGERHPDTLTSMNNLASTLQAMGDLKQARELQEEVLEVRRDVLGERHPDTLTSMSNFANTLQAMGDLKQARELQEEALKVRRAELGERHPDTLTSMGNLASTLYKMGDLKQARELEEEVLKVRRAELGERHPDTLTSMGNLALTLQVMGDLKQAKELQEEVLEFSPQVLGERHPDTLTAMNNLASTLYKMGDFEQAKALQEEVLEFSSQVLGERHPRTLVSMGNLAGTLRAMGEHDRARRLIGKLQRLTNDAD